MGAGMALDDAQIMAVSLEAILYGFSLLMFIGTIWALTSVQRPHATNRMMIAITVVLLILSTAHMIVDIVRTEEGLVKYRNTFPGGPVAFFANVAQNTYVVKNSLYTLQTLVGDGVVIYRCYVVWQSIWIVVLPVMLWCTVAVTAVGAVYNVSQATQTVSNIFAKQTGQWVTAFFASTLVTNLLSSGLLAFRIWTIERNTASIRTTRGTLMPVLRILVDSAALYSATLFTALICFVNGNHGETVLVSMTMPIISIAFYMVMIRIAMRQKNASRQASASLRGTSGSDSQDTNYGLKPLQARISRFPKGDFGPPPTGGDIERGLSSKEMSLKWAHGDSTIHPGGSPSQQGP